MADGYWIDCISEAFDEAGIAATAEQIALVAQHAEGARETYGMYSYQPANPMVGEIAELERKLRVERSKVGCSNCGGAGRERYNAGPWAIDTQCGVCHGEGKIAQ